MNPDECLFWVPREGEPLQDPELPPFGGQQLLAAARENCSENLDGLFVADVDYLVDCHMRLRRVISTRGCVDRGMWTPSRWGMPARASIPHLKGVQAPEAKHPRVNV